ncbi:hypothetical protein Glove_73g2 [Diversispora epigaea]|uniref:Zinc-ribbon domain-containing protein n=1 Tax=Diversispora epigaea TaxID=1348612 RepID=A0A397JDY4_9GLOM|nr:hypothetical protein Glove_73g2 [Diversispora epigaea]
MSQKLSLSIAIQIAKSRGGECLSGSYVNCKELLRWRCANLHEWSATLDNIKNGQKWCLYCNIKRYTLEDVKRFAQTMNGECLSESYTNCKKPLHWRCANLHEWFTSFRSIKNNNSWCPQCNVGQNTLEDMRAYAREKGGECLSDRYYNLTTKLLWICKNLHIWEAIPHNIKHGTWCPFCSNKYRREKLCRDIVTDYLGAPSKKRRPNFLKTQEHPTGLELDIYYPEYGFAIEVQGKQHEVYIEFLHRDPNNFIKQQARDQLKKELCEENWIVLREVWYYEDPYIVIPEHLRELGLIE